MGPGIRDAVLLAPSVPFSVALPFASAGLPIGRSLRPVVVAARHV